MSIKGISVFGLLAAFLGLLAEPVHADTYGPTISILSPSDGKTIWSTGSATYPVRIVFKAWDSDDVNTSTFTIRVDGNIVAGPSAMSNWGPSDANKTYHRYYDWNPVAYSDGFHTIQVSASDLGANVGSSKGVRIYMRKTALSNYSTFPGDGNLLVRDNDNTMCMACHNLKSHSSADMGSTTYGNWERVCRDCHTPHNTRNIFILASSFKIYTGTNQTYSYNRKVDFRNLSGESIYGFVTKTGNARRGPCEVCHTKTKNSNGTPRWRNYTSVPDSDGAKHNATASCIDCHKHTDGFSGSGSCPLCHYNGTGDVDNFTYGNGVRARLYSSEMNRRGHARPSGTYPHSANNAANKGCMYEGAGTGCHSSAVSHGLATNPFRLYTAASHPDDFCKDCHKQGSAKVAVSHSKAEMETAGYTGGANGWASWNFTPKCLDCHDPHGDKNNYMLHTYLNFSTNSDQFGVPPKDAGGNQIESAFMTFTAAGASPVWGDYVNASFTGICQRCHTPFANVTNFNKKGYNASHNPGQRCTGCHTHDSGFAPGESGGNSDCSGCHSDLFNSMNQGNNLYHHFIDNAGVDNLASGSKYPVITGIVGTASGNRNRRCLWCHVDHDIFRPDKNANSIGRGGNLRKTARVIPTTTEGFTNTDFVNQTSTSQGIWGGLCMSCHRKAQQKYTSMLANDGSAKAHIIPFPGGTPADFAATGHGSYSVPSTFGKDGSKFSARCSKCHIDTQSKTKQTSTNKFGLHGAPIRRVQALLGQPYDLGQVDNLAYRSVTSIGQSSKAWTANAWVGRSVSITAGTGRGQGRVIKRNTSDKLYVTQAWGTLPDTTSKFNVGDPVEEDLCYRCHSTKSTMNPYSTLGYDYYGIRKYNNAKAQMMYEQFNPSPSKYSGTSFTHSGTTITGGGTPNWTANQWAGALFIVTGGTDAGRYGSIVSNTTNTLTLSSCPKPNYSDRNVCDALTSGAFEIRMRSARHRVDAYAGAHETDEYQKAEDGPTNTPVGWFNSAAGGLHTGCADCHNPHAAKPQGLDRGRATNDAQSTFTTIMHDSTVQGQLGGTRNWATDEWRGYSVVILDQYTAIIGQERMIISNTANRLRVGAPFGIGTTSYRAPKGAYYIIAPKGRPPESIIGETPERAGNASSNANKGVWGVSLSYTNITASPTNPNSMKKNPYFTKKAAVERNYEICLKCHSDYGWGNNAAPFFIPDGLAGSEKFRNTTSSNIAREFNPNNLSHHAIYDIGKNQPLSPMAYQNIASAGTANTISISTADWTAGQWVGYTVTIVAGTGAGQFRTISSNTTTQLTVSSNWTTTPNSTSVFGIGKASYLNPNWPEFTTGTVGITTGGVATFSGAIPSTIIAGWYLYAGNANPPAGTVNGTNAFTGWYQIKKVLSSTQVEVTPSPKYAVPAGTAFHLTAGLGNNFVPPYGPWSVLSCADCHGAEKDQPAGPHAASRPWILRDLDEKIKFPWFNGTNVIQVSYKRGNLKSSTPYLCLNCHRADVYGNESNNSNGGTVPVRYSSGAAAWLANYARVPHPVDNMGGTSSGHLGAANIWKIGCMNCHGGSGGTLGPQDTMGSIHGSNLGKNPTGAAGGTSAGSYSGKRLLNGAAWLATTRATTTSGASCWTKNNTYTTDRVGSCGGSDSNTFMNGGVSATYNFDSAAD